MLLFDFVFHVIVTPHCSFWCQFGLYRCVCEARESAIQMCIPTHYHRTHVTVSGRSPFRLFKKKKKKVIVTRLHCTVPKVFLCSCAMEFFFVAARAYIDESNISNYLIAFMAALYLFIQWRNSRRGFGAPNTSWRREDLLPAERFLTELCRSGQQGNNKKIMAMLHSSFLAVTDRGIISALCRYASSELGAFVRLDDATTQLRQNEESCHLISRATFDLVDFPVEIEIAWRKGSSKGSQGCQDDECLPWSVVFINVVPPKMAKVDLIAFAKAEEFSAFGEHVVASLINRTPTFAHSVMVPELKSRYASPLALSQKIAPILGNCGGLKGRFSFNCSLRNASISNGVSRRIELEYTVLGEVKDIAVHVSLVVDELQCFLAHYSLSLR